jgi:hypothetical protein
MGQKVARNMPSMAARSFSKNQIEKAELIHESNQRESEDFCRNSGIGASSDS